MSFNLRFGLADDGANSWQNRKLLCAEILKLYPPTFIGVQESNHFQTRFLIQNLKDHEFIGWYNKSREQWQSNLIFYHNTWECLKAKHYFLSTTPDVESTLPGSKWPGSKTHAFFLAHGFFDAFENNHSTTFHNFTGEATRDHIDWILYRGNIKIIRRKIITDSFSGRYPSDHYPVMAVFQESCDLHF